MPGLICTHCGCSEIDTDQSRGDAVCTNCGTVLEDNIIVSEVQFEDVGHGSRAVGQMVSAEGQSSGGMNLGFQHGMSKESRLITLQKARNKVVQMSEQLRLNSHCIDMAYNFYKMALVKRLTRGRKSSHIVAACVYIVCRLEETSHLLLDLSDIVQVNVYELGRTYLYLSHALCISIPWIDPCVYIVRFAHRLEFGEKTHEVSMTAHRLVQRMKRDWMHTGRRPSGLCGAALLVAARMHDFNRTMKDIMKVVKVCEATLKKRLNEFGETPSGQLTLEEFMAIDLEEEQDPPCFKEARKKQKSLMSEESVVDDMANEITELQEQIENAIQERKNKLKELELHRGRSLSPSSLAESEVTENFILENTIETINETIGENFTSSQITIGSSQPIQSTCQALDSILLPEMDEDDVDCPGLYTPQRNASLAPTAESLGLKESIEDCMKVREPEVEEETDGELDLTGLDDTELDSYIMTDAEVKAKTTLWQEVHAEYLEEIREREIKRAQEAEENLNKPEVKKKKKVTRKKHNNIQANTAGEAIEKMLQEKKISTKINYDVLKSLKTSDVIQDPDVFKVPPSPVPSENRTPRKDLRSGRPGTPKEGGTPPSSICGIMSSIFAGQNKRKYSPEIKTNKEPPTKVNVKEVNEIAAPTPQNDLVEEVEEEEIEEEDQPISAAQLLYRRN